MRMRMGKRGSSAVIRLLRPRRQEERIIPAVINPWIDAGRIPQ